MTEEINELHTNVDSALQSLILVVSDNGKGFPPEETDKVFDKFYRLKNTKTGGTGFGLIYCERLCRCT